MRACACVCVCVLKSFDPLRRFHKSDERFTLVIITSSLRLCMQQSTLMSDLNYQSYFNVSFKCMHFPDAEI